MGTAHRSDQNVLGGRARSQPYGMKGSAELGSEVDTKEERYIQSKLFLKSLKTLGLPVTR